ncbi:MAG: hypothetical protein Q8P46_01305 [Hyphomicrobiales bacterium]|nr:hypothetical protein [Hyphomicrobiales bacterium]
MQLLQPIEINGMKVSNRVVVPAMVTRLSGEDGHVNQDIIDRYVRYAKGEIGLIVVEAMAIHKSKSGPLLRISDEDYVPGLTDLVSRIHDSSDSKVVPQIIHFLKVARSGWRQTLDMLSLEDIELIVEQFGDAVARARAAGFDGAELHSAHAYTLASFLSRANPRTDEYAGRTLEGRLTMIGRVMENVRKKVGTDFPVGVRYVADEYIKDGYTIGDAKLIGLRLAQLGFDYLSLSVGGKFEDAIHKQGEVPYPYTGYSGDRCMPGDWYPPALHAHLGGEIKAFVNEKGYDVPVMVAGKISDPDIAERLVADGVVDMVAIARGLLADPDWVKKVKADRRDHIIQCDYCNWCKILDGTHQKVRCTIWPKDALQAPEYALSNEVPAWPEAGAGLKGEYADGAVTLSWNGAVGSIAGYDIYRAEDSGDIKQTKAVKARRWNDRTVMAGVKYRYYVRARDESGHPSAPSDSVVVEPRMAPPQFA